MSNIKKAGSTENSESSEVGLPQSKVQHILQDLEILSLQKGSKGVDLSDFSENQKDKLLDIIAKNEDNAFKFHTKRLETFEKIAVSRINSTTINQKTIRIVLLILVIIFLIITILILFYKENFFIPWLTFLTGIGSGIGLSKAGKILFKEPQIPDSELNPDKNKE
jgi:hypothetical protein